MKVRIDSLAWLPKSELTVTTLQVLKERLTIRPKKVPEYDDGTDNEPIELFRETDTEIGIAREFFLENRRAEHEIELAVTDGDKSTWPGPLEFASDEKLRVEQEQALIAVLSAFRRGQLGGILQAKGGWGKTTWGCALIAALQRPTLVVVHKEFLMSQWAKRIKRFLPAAEIGFAQEDECDFRDKHIVIGMVHSLAKNRYGEEFRNWPGLMIVDETHRVGARTWSPVPALFACRYKIGITATPRRKDGAENVFRYHIGPILFTAKEQRLAPAIHKLYTKFKLVTTPSFNPKLAPESLILNFLCANEPRNRLLVETMINAVTAGRKLLVLSKRINHLNRIEQMFRREWREQKLGPEPSVDYYIGGMKEGERDKAGEARVILGTAQYCCVDANVAIIDPITGLSTTLAECVDNAEMPFVVGGITDPSVVRPAGCGLTGKKKCVTITLADGATTTVSADHRMWTTRGWVEAQDLVAGKTNLYEVNADYLACPRKISVPIRNTDLTADDAWLIGLLIGDGSLSQIRKGVAQLTTDDAPIVAEANRVLAAHGMVLKYRRHQHYDIRLIGGKKGRRRYEKTWLRQLVERLDLVKTARFKTIPEELMLAPDSVAKALLAGYFDSDGCRTKNGCPSFSSTSFALLEQIRTLLARFGFPVLHSLCPDKDGCASLRLARADWIPFLRFVPSRLPRRGTPVALDDVLAVGASNCVPPQLCEELKAELRKRKLVGKAKLWCKKKGLSYSGLISPFRAMTIQAFDFIAKKAGLSLRADRSLVWRRVVSVKRVGYKLVGDFSVPPTKAWVFGGVIVHNSEGLDLPALDTLFLAVPMVDVEQMIYRICRPYEGKKAPIVVDVRDDLVPRFKGYGRSRDKLYNKMGWVRDAA